MLRTLYALACVAPLAISAGCSGSAMCVPDGSPPCECNPCDTRACNGPTGNPGLEACMPDGTWSNCAEFDPDAMMADEPAEDVPPFDAGIDASE